MSAKAYDLEKLFYKRMNEGVVEIVERLGGTVTVDVEKEIFDIDLDENKKEEAAIQILTFMELLQMNVLKEMKETDDCKWVGNVGWKI